MAKDMTVEERCKGFKAQIRTVVPMDEEWICIRTSLLLEFRRHLTYAMEQARREERERWEEKFRAAQAADRTWEEAKGGRDAEQEGAVAGYVAYDMYALGQLEQFTVSREIRGICGIPVTVTERRVEEKS